MIGAIFGLASKALARFAREGPRSLPRFDPGIVMMDQDQVFNVRDENEWLTSTS